MALEQDLARLGIEGNLYTVYCACIGLGEASVSSVIARAQLPKSTVYDALEKLEKAGLVAISAGLRNRTVSAHHPNVLLDQHESKRRMLDEMMPGLKALFYRAQGKPNVRFYEGDDGVSQALWDSLHSDDEELLSCFPASETLEYAGIPEMDAYIKERVRSGKKLKVLRSLGDMKKDLWPSSRGELREVRYTPDSVHMAMTFVIYGKSVVFLSSKKESYGMVIDSADFSTLLTAMFKGIWEISTPGEINDCDQ